MPFVRETKVFHIQKEKKGPPSKLRGRLACKKFVFFLCVDTLDEGTTAPTV